MSHVPNRPLRLIKQVSIHIRLAALVLPKSKRIRDGLAKLMEPRGTTE
jgi:hypothetical protein